MKLFSFLEFTYEIKNIKTVTRVCYIISLCHILQNIVFFRQKYSKHQFNFTDDRRKLLSCITYLSAVVKVSTDAIHTRIRKTIRLNCSFTVVYVLYWPLFSLLFLLGCKYLYLHCWHCLHTDWKHWKESLGLIATSHPGPVWEISATSSKQDSWYLHSL